MDGMIDITEEFESAPSAVCGRCQRHTWAPTEFGKEDRMTQPDGFPCGGRFTDPTVDAPR